MLHPYNLLFSLSKNMHRERVFIHSNFIRQSRGASCNIGAHEARSNGQHQVGPWINNQTPAPVGMVKHVRTMVHQWGLSYYYYYLPAGLCLSTVHSFVIRFV